MLLTALLKRRGLSASVGHAMEASTCVRSRQKGVRRRPPLSLSWFFHRKEEARQGKQLRTGYFE